LILDAPVSSQLTNWLREYTAAAYAGRSVHANEIRAQLMAIDDELTRLGALDRFHTLLVCTAVMKVDPTNYQRAVRKACEELTQFLERTSASEESQATGSPRRASARK
jgi:hypothetical protein